MRSCKKCAKPVEFTNFIEFAVSEPVVRKEIVAPEPVKVEPVLPEPPKPEPKATVPEPEKKPPVREKKKIEVSKTLVTRDPIRKPPQISEEKIRQALNETVKPLPSVASQTPDFAWYYAMVHDQVYAVWQQPGALSRSAGITTRMLITVNRDGNVLSSRIVSPSGNDQMDQSVLKAVAQITKLPQLPQNKPGSTKEITIDFLLSD